MRRQAKKWLIIGTVLGVLVLGLGLLSGTKVTLFQVELSTLRLTRTVRVSVVGVDIAETVVVVCETPVSDVLRRMGRVTGLEGEQYISGRGESLLVGYWIGNSEDGRQLQFLVSNMVLARFVESEGERAIPFLRTIVLDPGVLGREYGYWDDDALTRKLSRAYKVYTAKEGKAGNRGGK